MRLRRATGLTAACLVAWMCLGSGAAFDQADVAAAQVTEIDVKAAFLFNFTRFVQWPDNIPPASEPFRLCVIADPATTDAIERTMAGELVHGRPSQILVPSSADDVRRCQILFVGRSEARRAAPLLDAIRDQPVLTVSDAARFAARGGIIEFVRHENRVRFDINVEAARRHGLNISSRLLRVARKIEGPPR